MRAPVHGLGAELREVTLGLLLLSRITMAIEERLEQLERSLQQAGNALQAANNRISSLETAAGTTTSAASGNPQSSLVMKRLGRVGASSCCPSLQQFHLNCVL